MKDDAPTEYRLKSEIERAGWYWSASDDSGCYGPFDTAEEARAEFWHDGAGEEIFNEIVLEGEVEGLTKEDFLAGWEYITHLSSWPISTDIFDADHVIEALEEKNEEAVWGECEPTWPKEAKRELEQMLGQSLFDWMKKHDLWKEFRGLQQRTESMAIVKALTEFSAKEIRKQGEISRAAIDEEKRKKAKRLQLEMMAYNARALRGDFDKY